MATLTSSPATVSVTSFPYSLPTSPGQVVAIGTNNASAVRPNTHSAHDWEYACFGYYGGGVFVPNYSQGGAWAVAGSGGHDVPPNIGACIFDFQDATWKRKDNANGVPWTRVDYPIGAVNYPFGEINGASPPGIPAPAHRYAVARSMAVGGGAQGSVVTLVSNWQGNDPNTGWSIGATFYAHAMNLQTGLWTRRSTNACIGARHDGGQVDEFFASAYDAVTNRYYIFHRAQYALPLGYLDGNDWTWKQISVPTFSVNGYSFGCFIDESRRLLVMGTSSSQLFGLNLNNPTAGWRGLNVTGPLSSLNSQMQWAFYPPNGCYYTKNDHVSSSTLFKLVPPPPNPDPFAGTWSVSTISLNASLPAPVPDWYSGGAHSHNRIFYVPSIQCLAWIADGNNVRLIKPF